MSAEYVCPWCGVTCDALHPHIERGLCDVKALRAVIDKLTEEKIEREERIDSLEHDAKYGER